ncbi:MAG: PAS domain-containing protein [Kiloniellales bacterium]|nr:PAS domain-containing protein [Kiloniellales bacterium]
MNPTATTSGSEDRDRARTPVPTASDLAGKVVAYLTERGEGQRLAAFPGLEIKGLELVLEPSEQDLAADELKAVLRYWQDLPRRDGIPDVIKVEPDRLLSALGYLMLIDFGEAEDDFRYALYGSKIAKVSGFDMTGKSIWDIPTTSAVQVFFAACYMAVGRLKRPIYSVHEAPPAITVSHWHRLILPLGKDGEVRRLLVCNVPISKGKPL